MHRDAPITLLCVEHTQRGDLVRRIEGARVEGGQARARGPGHPGVVSGEQHDQGQSEVACFADRPAEGLLCGRPRAVAHDNRQGPDHVDPRACPLTPNQARRVSDVRSSGPTDLRRQLNGASCPRRVVLLLMMPMRALPAGSTIRPDTQRRAVGHPWARAAAGQGSMRPTRIAYRASSRRSFRPSLARTFAR